jgi:hypothetical protein
MKISPEEKVLNAFCKLAAALGFLLFCLIICFGFFHVLDKITRDSRAYFLGGIIYMGTIILLDRIVNRRSVDEENGKG